MKKLNIVLLISLAFFSCKKKTQSPGKLNLNIRHEVDGAALIMDTMLYINAAGELYSIQNLEYYLSSFQLKGANDEVINLPGIFYINSKKQNVIEFTLPFDESVKLKSISFDVGLNANLNNSNSLPSTIENVNMSWPDMMGGGYHFMKLEGAFTDSGGLCGYAIHLGTPSGLIHCTIPLDVLVNGNEIHFSLVMNINELFRNPINYSMRNDGHSTMGDSILMAKIATNGSDIFKIN